MQVMTYEAVVENGQIKLPDSVWLPEKTKVYVVVPGAPVQPQFLVVSPVWRIPNKPPILSKK